MPRVTRAPIVDTDLLEIWLYVAQDNVEAADRLLDRIDACCRTLAKAPRAGRAREELGPGVRSHPVGRYVIYYRKVSAGIEVIRVLSGYRDISSLM
jgi:toxin ParE1/3/4